jgi:hypothetical protein
VPLDIPAVPPLATPEQQDAYLEAAFASRHPMLIADAVNKVAQLRADAGIPTDESWDATLELFQSISNTHHLLEAVAETEAYLKATGETLIAGPTTT